MSDKDTKRELLKNVVAVLTGIVLLFSIVQTLFGLPIFNKLLQLITQKPEWVWYKGFLIYLSFVIATILCGWLWHPKFFKYVRETYSKRLAYLLSKIAFSLLVFLPFTLFLTLIMFEDRLPNLEGKNLFPQAADMGPVFFRNYATNGIVRHKFISENTAFGPKNGFVEIYFKLFGKSDDYNAGWVIYLLRGVDLSKYKTIRFLIRGEAGNEVIGIKAKDARGTEVQIELKGDYLRKGKITTNWQEAIVPFSHFGRVEFNLMENFSIYTTGDLAETIPQKIYLGDFLLK